MKSKFSNFLTAAGLLTTSFVISVSPCSAATIFKDDNIVNLDLGASWVGGTRPDVSDIAIWDSRVTSANMVIAGADPGRGPLWGSLRIENPAGQVTIDVADRLRIDGLNGVGIDMRSATQNLMIINGAVRVRESQSWEVAEDRLLTVGSDVETNGGLPETLTVTGAGNTTIYGTVSTNLSLSKEGAGILTLNGINPYTGATDVKGGKLVVAGSLEASAVTVSGAGTILATDAAASFGDTLLVQNGAILAPGDAGPAGTATVTGATTFDNGSIFSWDISANGASYDKLVSAGSLADGGSIGGSVFQIVVADTAFANAFWNTNQTWTDIFTTDGMAAIPNWADIFTSVSVVNSSFAPIITGGAFSVSGNTLTWSAVPEPTSALAGLLLAAGLLRRRRN